MTFLDVSFLIAAKEPKKLSVFYSFAINGCLQRGENDEHFLVSNNNGIKIQIYRPSDDQMLTSKGRTSSICFGMPPVENPTLSIEQWSSELTAKGARVLEGPLKRSFGVEAWMMDPEGNYFLIFIPVKR